MPGAVTLGLKISVSVTVTQAEWKTRRRDMLDFAQSKVLKFLHQRNPYSGPRLIGICFLFQQICLNCAFYQIVRIFFALWRHKMFLLELWKVKKSYLNKKHAGLTGQDKCQSKISDAQIQLQRLGPQSLPNWAFSLVGPAQTSCQSRQWNGVSTWYELMNNLAGQHLMNFNWPEMNKRSLLNYLSGGNQSCEEVGSERRWIL